MITILENAHKRFNELTQKNRKVFVRLSVKGGGCAGFNYDWSFENEKGPNDVLVDGILLVDKMYELYVIGMELDYRYDDFESAFVFNNPKAKSSCGCGTSFSI